MSRISTKRELGRGPSENYERIRELDAEIYRRRLPRLLESQANKLRQSLDAASEGKHKVDYLLGIANAAYDLDTVIKTYRWYCISAGASQSTKTDAMALAPPMFRPFMRDFILADYEDYTERASAVAAHSEGFVGNSTELEKAIRENNLSSELLSQAEIVGALVAGDQGTLDEIYAGKYQNFYSSDMVYSAHPDPLTATCSAASEDKVLAAEAA